MLGLILQKEGMSRIFKEDGTSTPVTVLKLQANVISQIKSSENEGYSSIQISSIDRTEKNVSKSRLGHFKKNNIPTKRIIKEFRVSEEELQNFEIGNEIKVDIFEEGQFVDVTSTTKGKGFSGTVKRWNFATQDATHGNSLAHRKPGSIGQCQTPGRVWKGKKMAGHLGNTQQTTQNLKVERVDSDNNLILIKGAVPGAPGSSVTIKPSIKKQ